MQSINSQFLKKLSEIKADIKDKINSDIASSMFYDTELKKYRPYVCIVCDRFIKFKCKKSVTRSFLENHHSILLPDIDRCIPESVKSYYTYNGNGSSEILKRCLLSQKGICYKSSKCVEDMFIICESCNSCLHKKLGVVPQYAIANSFEIGCAPDILNELSDIELAFISEVTVHSHLICYEGGHKGIRGWHSLVKTNLVSKREALGQMDLVNAIPNHLYIVLYGNWTEKQRKKISSLITIRRDKCKAAIDFLLANNRLYKDVSIDLDALKPPVIIDNGKPIHSVDTNIESKYEMTVVFPDSTLQEDLAGYENYTKYKEAVEFFKAGGTEAELKLPDSHYVRDFEDSNFIRAFPKQFPYGIGGPDEICSIRQNNSYGKICICDYIKHIVSLSNPSFQESQFTLVCYNMWVRYKMVQYSYLKLGDENLNEKYASLNSHEVATSVKKKAARAGIRVNIPEKTRPESEVDHQSDVHNRADVANHFMDDVIACCSSLPHGNGAARNARKDVFSMMCKHGPPDVFFTVSPPDDNSFFIDVYSGFKEGTQNIRSFSKFKENAARRKRIPLKYPGLSTLNFERIIEIVKERIIGICKNGSYREGFFGKPIAWFSGTEEQSRFVLHMHFLIWIHKLPFNRNILTTNKVTEKIIAKHKNSLIKYADQVSSNYLVGKNLPSIYHKCKDGKYSRKKFTLRMTNV